jgi:hypothetical protein
MVSWSSVVLESLAEGSPGPSSTVMATLPSTMPFQQGRQANMESRRTPW